MVSNGTVGEGKVHHPLGRIPDFWFWARAGARGGGGGGGGGGKPSRSLYFGP